LGPEEWRISEMKPGVTIFNNRVSRLEANAPPLANNGIENIIDASFLTTELRGAGLDEDRARRLAALWAGLEARLEKDATLSEDSFRIVIGPKKPCASR
jgi:hypothetical protein